MNTNIKWSAELAAVICKSVAELPDRNSPEGWPDAMLVTHDELATIVTAALAAPAQPVAHVSQETFNDDGTSDIIIPALPIGMALYAALAAPARAVPAPVKRTVWVNLYGRQLESVCHPTEEDADKHASPNRIGGKAYPLEIEEGAQAVPAVPAIGQTDFDAVAPTQAGEYQPSSADMVMAALDTEEWGLERMQRWDCITDEGNRVGAWLVKRQKSPYCAVYTDKPGEPYGPRSWSGPTALDALQKAADDLGIRLPQPAARGAALAALKHPAVKPDMLVNGGALKLALNVLRRAGKNEVADELEATAQAAPVDAAKLPSPANVGTAPKCLNLNDQAMWVLGWNECLDAAIAAQKGSHD